jgi:hypothetical protein
MSPNGTGPSPGVLEDLPQCEDLLARSEDRRTSLVPPTDPSSERLRGLGVALDGDDVGGHPAHRAEATVVPEAE